MITTQQIQQYREVGAVVVPGLRNPLETRAFIEAESKHWLPIIKEAGIKV